MKARTKKALNVILDVLVILILVISLIVVVLAVSSKKNDGVPCIFGHTLLSVKTDSMEPTIMVGDLIIGRVADSGAEYELGDVVTFKEIVNKTIVYNSHRIVEKTKVDGTVYYRTKGDNSPGWDDGAITSWDIAAVWEGKKIPVIGGILEYLRSGEGFFIFLMVPVILFFLYYLYKFIKSLVLYNREKAIESAKEAAAEVEEDQKRKIIEEYLASQKEKNAEKDGTGNADGNGTESNEDNNKE